ncbi:MAG: hypothetical protein JNM69_27470, partial [Archangium sp.]|nr:hypothetical protein [Archangium sp.]
MQLRCPECLTVVTLDDATPPERRPTHCARCAVNVTLNTAVPRLELMAQLRCSRCENTWSWPAAELDEREARVQCGRCHLMLLASEARVPVNGARAQTQPVFGTPQAQTPTLALPTGPPPRHVMLFGAGSNARTPPLQLDATHT